MKLTTSTKHKVHDWIKSLGDEHYSRAVMRGLVYLTMFGSSPDDFSDGECLAVVFAVDVLGHNLFKASRDLIETHDYRRLIEQIEEII